MTKNQDRTASPALLKHQGYSLEPHSILTSVAGCGRRNATRLSRCWGEDSTSLAKLSPLSLTRAVPRRLGNCITDSIYITILHDVMSILLKRSDMLSQKTSLVDVRKGKQRVIVRAVYRASRSIGGLDPLPSCWQRQFYKRATPFHDPGPPKASPISIKEALV
jgi:hypothetical protein